MKPNEVKSLIVGSVVRDNSSWDYGVITRVIHTDILNAYDVLMMYEVLSARPSTDLKEHMVRHWEFKSDNWVLVDGKDAAYRLQRFYEELVSQLQLTSKLAPIIWQTGKVKDL